MADSDDAKVPDPVERRDSDPKERRAFFRGGRRVSDWPTQLLNVRCPRCQSAETRFIEATPETLFWECHACRHEWTTGTDGRPPIA